MDVGKRQDQGWARQEERHAREGPRRVRATAHLDHQHSHGFSSSKSMFSRRSAGGQQAGAGSWPPPPAEARHSSGAAGSVGTPGGWAGGARGGGGSSHGVRSGSREERKQLSNKSITYIYRPRGLKPMVTRVHRGRLIRWYLERRGYHRAALRQLIPKPSRSPEVSSYKVRYYILYKII